MSACPNCGYDPETACIGNIPVEELVDDEVRAQQYADWRRGKTSRHAIAIVSNAPERKAVPA